MNVIARAPGKSAGLFVARTTRPVALQGVKVRAGVVGHAARVTMTQRFRNAEDRPIEAVYVFPAPEAAAVCGLVMVVGDRRIEAEVEERDRAFERYDDAMAAGHGAALLDVERPNVFTISVGNILPGQEVAVEIAWVADLPMEGQAIRFMLPTTVAPRYAPEEDQRGVSPTPAERVAPPIALDVPYGLSLEVDVALASAIRTVESPSHPVRVELAGPKARVTLSHGLAAMDRDFVLLVTPEETGRPQVLVERNADGLATACVSLVPQLPASDGPREIVFLVDRSGSMAGTSIEQVQAALHLCLRSLRDGDLFNIVGFGSTFAPLFPASVAYGQASLEQASAHVDAIQADMGGTEILPALQSVLEGRVPAGARRQVVVLTDGEVTNEAAVIDLSESHRADTRIFTFGIGYGASEHLVRSVARVTMGEAEFIHPGERIEPKVLRQFARLGTPALRDVKVEWQGAEATLQAPHGPVAVFNGEASVLYARFAPSRPVTLAVSADAEGTPVRWTVPVNGDDAETGDVLATLAARAAIRDLEEGTSALHDRLRGSRQAGRREARIAKEIATLAKTYRLASSRTSFVAVEYREAAEGQPAAELRRVPAMLAHGWGGAERAIRGLAATSAILPSMSLHNAVYNVQVAAHAIRARTAGEPAKEVSGLFDEDACALARAHVSAGPAHVALARLQRADGSWRIDRTLLDLLGVDRDPLLEAAAQVGGPNAQSIAATLAALRFLQTRAADARDEWRLLAEKAERWLDAAFEKRPAGARADAERLVASLIGS